LEAVVQNPLRRIEAFTEKLGTRISVATGLGKAAAAAETAAIENAANRATEARLKNVIEDIGPTDGDGAVMAAEVNIPVTKSQSSEPEAGKAHQILLVRPGGCIYRQRLEGVPGIERIAADRYTCSPRQSTFGS
jgi:hypothetical protein